MVKIGESKPTVSYSTTTCFAAMSVYPCVSAI
uniref:Uncharacterized protein n=1 Tax=Arundo donax TaxID=35708 RepID=A0A0A9E2Q6_ARUDO